MAAAPLYCVCRQPYDVSRFMIECDICKDWFHGSCVQVEEHHAVDIDVYHCPNCDVVNGPSLMKRRTNWHRHDYTEPDDGSKPVQAGTAVFISQLQNRSFASGEEVLVRMQGESVTPRYLEKHGFSQPIAVTEMEGLGLRLPPPSFSVRDVEQYVGGNKVIDVIDVARQADSKMKLSEFIKYYTGDQRPKVLNLISLEFSDTRMSELVVVPDVAQQMSWVENYWPDDSFFPKPFVQKYCLMGVKGCYTDFHIDFGGTSVWYHVLWGEKIFYLIPPTVANLALYEAWSSSTNQSEVFFGDKVDKCYKCVVPQGTTLLIPTGWIHAVLTSQDCMAFGGNFLHNLNIGMQLRCYEMERRLKTPDLFKFPYFEAICWYVAKNLLETLKELREDSRPPQTYLVEGVKALIGALKTWLKREVTEPTSEVPDHIRPNHLIKELTKEVRYLEVREQQPADQDPVCGQAVRARRAARKLREQQRLAPKASSNLDVLERHTREVLRRLEVGPLEEVSHRCHGNARMIPRQSRSDIASWFVKTSERFKLGRNDSRIPHNVLTVCVCVCVCVCVLRERPTSPSTAEAIQGMLSMAGLLCPSDPQKEAPGPPEPWWSGPEGPPMPTPAGGPPHLHPRLHGDAKSPMDSQGNSSSEAWDHRGPETDTYQYCDPSMSPPLHPSKRPAPNPPPISNQATKGKRPKKGMATAKQRLSKILKISRHSRVFV
uniref:Uncharacterized protein n=1 Tax=Gadus morhua TaxID=8049 RepID=A0A8C5BVT7_GADMO